MRKISALVFAATLTVLPSHSIMAQTNLERSENLATCLSGRYPSLCKKHWLSPGESKKAESAEYRENLNTCLAGRYPTLCKTNKLSAGEAQQVVAAERGENLRTCLTGRYPSLCKKSLLSEVELKQVLAVEQSENLRTCLIGRYPSLCKKSLLTREQLSQTQAAESRAAKALKQPVGKALTPRSRGHSSSGCESEHWVESVSDDGQIIKLEDGSIWNVDAVDAIDSALWLPTTDIIACNGKLINTDDNETVSAIRIR